MFSRVLTEEKAAVTGARGKFYVVTKSHIGLPGLLWEATWSQLAAPT